MKPKLNLYDTVILLPAAEVPKKYHNKRGKITQIKDLLIENSKGKSYKSYNYYLKLFDLDGLLLLQDDDLKYVVCITDLTEKQIELALI